MSENIKLFVNVPPKVDKLIRRQAFFENITLGEVIIKYQNAYLREKEREKAEKQQKEPKKE